MMNMENIADKYRYERKFLIRDLSVQEIETIIKLHPNFFSEIYYQRNVNNIYFDSLELESYQDNVTGSAQRVKTRIRWYGELFGLIEKPVLELKIKSNLLGRKESFLLSPFDLNRDFSFKTVFDVIEKSDVTDLIKERFNYLQPVLLNRYKRKYFQSADKKYRITVDSEMSFRKIGKYNNSFLSTVNDKVNVILELKYDYKNEENAKNITNLFPFRLTKSSKYLSGVDSIYD
jgi:SPX domain protein involved in polyphosphate accumulation